MAAVVALSLRNRSDKNLTLILEPIAVGYSLEANADCDLVVSPPQDTPPIVVFQDDCVEVFYHGAAAFVRNDGTEMHAIEAQRPEPWL
jgi:hypothetical protein